MFGLAAHFGQFRVAEDVAGTLEDQASGSWIASQAEHRQKLAPPRATSLKPQAYNGWARDIIGTSARRTAQLCRNIHLALDPPRIVIGGGIGLASGYLDTVRQHWKTCRHGSHRKSTPPPWGKVPAVVGIADLAKNHHRGERK